MYSSDCSDVDILESIFHCQSPEKKRQRGMERVQLHHWQLASLDLKLKERWMIRNSNLEITIFGWQTSSEGGTATTKKIKACRCRWLAFSFG